MCVIKHSFKRNILGLINTYILVSDLIPVKYVIRGSLKRVNLQNINAYTARDLIHVMYVIKYLDVCAVLENINAYILVTSNVCNKASIDKGIL
jgi:hypothetical protein